MFDARKHKENQKTYWDYLAPVYDHSFSALMHPATLKMVDLAQLKEGDRVLDIACGTGNEAFLALRKVGKTGSVVGIDISQGMIDKANEKARSRGLKNIEFQVMDAEKLKYDDNSFDAVISQWGFMLFPDSHRALLEARRVTKAGGRMSSMVMGRAEHCQFITIVAAIALKEAPATITAAEGGPSQFMFGPEGAFESALRAAEFAGVHTRRFSSMITVRDADAFWRIFQAGVGGFSYRLTKQPEAVQQRIIAGVKNAVSKYTSGDGLRLPIEVVIGVGHKAAKGEKEGVRRKADPISYAQMVDAARARVTSITPEQLEKELAAGAAVLDVRQAEEVQSGMIAKAVHLPRGRIENSIGKQVPDARTPIITYCDDGVRSLLAAEAISQFGYRRPMYLEGGLAKWKASGRPVGG